MRNPERVLVAAAGIVLGGALADRAYNDYFINGPQQYHAQAENTVFLQNRRAITKADYDAAASRWYGYMQDAATRGAQGTADLIYRTQDKTLVVRASKLMGDYYNQQKQINKQYDELMHNNLYLNPYSTFPENTRGWGDALTSGLGVLAAGAGVAYELVRLGKAAAGRRLPRRQPRAMQP